VTGGIGARTLAATVRGSSDATARLVVRGKALAGRAQEFTDLLRDLLLRVRLDDRERFRQILLEEKAGAEERLLPEGSAYVRRRACAPLRRADWAAERMEGASYLLFLKALEEDVGRDWPAVLARLEAVRAALVRRGGLVLNATADPAAWPRCEPLLRGLAASVPDGAAAPALWQPGAPAAREGLSVPSKVSYVGLAADLVGAGYRLHGSAFAVLKHLRTVWLWERVRVRGGAYGSSCSLDPLSGLFCFTSYRDPNIQPTFDVFRGAGAHLRGLAPAREEIERSIIGAIGEMDAHQLPDAKGLGAMSRHLCRLTDEARQRTRDELLSTGPGHFAAFGEALDAALARACEVVMGDPARLQASGCSKLTRLL
jgi:hypothetical protein